MGFMKLDKVPYLFTWLQSGWGRLKKTWLEKLPGFLYFCYANSRDVFLVPIDNCLVYYKLTVKFYCSLMMNIICIILLHIIILSLHT